LLERGEGGESKGGSGGLFRKVVQRSKHVGSNKRREGYGKHNQSIDRGGSERGAGNKNLNR